MRATRAKTPCVGICSTSIGGDVCRGCKRFGHEIIDWNGYSDEQRQLVLSRLDQFIQQIVSNKIEIVNVSCLKQQIVFQQLNIDLSLSPSRWVYELLRQGASQIHQPEAFGIKVREPWHHYSLEEVKQLLEDDFYALSSAHYERYFSV